MNTKKNLLTFAMVGLIAMLLCLPGTVLGKSPTPPGVPEGKKLIGPMLKGVLIAAWTPTQVVYEDGVIVDVWGTWVGFVKIQDKLYVIEATDVPACEFYQFAKDEDGIVGSSFLLPLKIGEDFKVPGGEPVIFDVKDVSDHGFIDFCNSAVECPEPGTPECFDCYDDFHIYVGSIKTCDPVELSYNYVVHCAVRISFLVPKK